MERTALKLRRQRCRFVPMQIRIEVPRDPHSTALNVLAPGTPLPTM